MLIPERKDYHIGLHTITTAQLYTQYSQYSQDYSIYVHVFYCMARLASIEVVLDFVRFWKYSIAIYKGLVLAMYVL